MTAPQVAMPTQELLVDGTRVGRVHGAALDEAALARVAARVADSQSKPGPWWWSQRMRY